MAGMNDLAQVNPYANMYQAPGYSLGEITTLDPQAQDNQPQVNPYANMYQAPGYTPGEITGSVPEPVYQPLTLPTTPYQPTPAPYQPLTQPEPVYQPAPQLYQAPGYTPGEITGEISQPPYQALTYPVYQDQVNPYADLYSAPAPQAPAAYTRPMTQAEYNQTLALDSGVRPFEPDTSQALPQEIRGGLNQPLFDRYVTYVQQARTYQDTPPDINSEQDFRDFVQASTGSNLLPSELAPRPRPQPVISGVDPRQEYLKYQAARASGTVLPPPALAPSQPGYVAPTGRVYANWTPKRKVT